MGSPTLVASFTPLLVMLFSPFMMAALAVLFHNAGAMPAALDLYPTRVDINVLSHGGYWCECKRRGE